jgi:DNA-directed RNA polymerase subunit RPC12/RpoP
MTASDEARLVDSTLDGNAIGGLLHEVFGTEMTTAVGTCAACGAAAQIAETLVYLTAMGTVVRCRACTSILLVVIRRDDVNCVDLTGLTALEAR